jgi:enoyl-CoA hydratase
MASNLILYTQKGHTAYITLNRPETGNRIDLGMAQELVEACARINGDENIYLAVITGAGNAFCSGMDDRQLIFTDNEGLPSRISPAEAVAKITCPTLAALNGEAVGEGLELALACDLRVASDKAWFGLPQITEGYIPMDGGTQRLTRIVGKGKALELVLMGEIIDARAAADIGLVNKVVEHENLATEVEAITGNISGKAPFALRYCKEAVHKGLDMTLEQGLRLEADLYFLLHTTADRTEGIQAFVQKRPPQYQGK